jgi:hypothetical protein
VQLAVITNTSSLLYPSEKTLAIYFHNHIEQAKTLWEKLGGCIFKRFSTQTNQRVRGEGARCGAIV